MICKYLIDENNKNLFLNHNWIFDYLILRLYYENDKGKERKDTKLYNII